VWTCLRHSPDQGVNLLALKFNGNILQRLDTAEPLGNIRQLKNRHTGSRRLISQHRDHRIPPIEYHGNNVLG
jgi:hypothetical protein